MSNGEPDRGKEEREKACAQMFLDWLASHRGVSYEVERAADVPGLNGRWDFVVRQEKRSDWLAVEIKSLVIPSQRRHLWDWSKLCRQATKRLQEQIRGTFWLVIGPNIPLTFDQHDRQLLLDAFCCAMMHACADLEKDKSANLGPRIKCSFRSWPTKQPRSDRELWREKGIYEVVHTPEDLFVCKVDGTGCSMEVASVFGAFEVDPALTQAVLSIFNPSGEKGAKPNEQLHEAKQKGAVETVLLLDSHIRWKPNAIAKLLNGIDQSLLYHIDVVYLVGASSGQVKKVWP